MTSAASGRRKRLVLTGLALGLCLLFAGLGVWQVARLVWKLELIDQVETRIDAPAVSTPGPAEWPHVTAAGDQYRRVATQGRFLHDRETRVQAVTALGAGHWLMTPLVTDDGFVVLVNRGFLPARSDRAPAPTPERPSGRVELTGLLRISEPGGGFLRANAPSADRWTSRDVATIAETRGLTGAVAPYFIDAAADTGQNVWPRGGLTVVRFSNNHLVYALTWFALAALAGFGAWRFARSVPGDLAP
ncbi:SURF1 family protein [Brevundimonas sp. VNH65]|uniref:SURF1 family protein n=1 Tax=Brevundimonas sp. VNH65 TaxID=3400917 RepID=UPI003C122CA5